MYNRHNFLNSSHKITLDGLNTSITLFWQPVKVASIFEISISAEGYLRRRTYVPSNQAQYELQGLLPDTTYNVSLWLVALLKGSSASMNGPFLV